MYLTSVLIIWRRSLLTPKDIRSDILRQTKVDMVSRALNRGVQYLMKSFSTDADFSPQNLDQQRTISAIDQNLSDTLPYRKVDANKEWAKFMAKVSIA